MTLYINFEVLYYIVRVIQGRIITFQYKKTILTNFDGSRNP